jgi:ribonuclease VapC
MIFVDASALVSIIAREADASALGRVLAGGAPIISSAISVWETVTALCKNHRYSNEDARTAVADLFKDLQIKYVPIGERESELAALAYEKFGKGRHAAALNMGDCFAYACAKANNAKLLFKGDDFAKTDIAAA